MTPGNNLTENAKEHVSVQGSLVGLVHDHCTVPIQVRLDQRLTQQHTIRHVLDERVLVCAILEADGIPDSRPQFAALLISNPLCHRHGGNTSWLGTSNQPVESVACFVEVLGKLRRLSGSRLPDAHENLVLSQQLKKFFPHLVHGEALTLLLDGLVLGKVGGLRCRLIPQGIAVLARCLVIKVLVVFTILSLFVGFGPLLHSQHLAHVCSSQLPEASSELAGFLVLADLLHDL
mmetsp:Transcript_64460/g.168752  ORF Transcript_64460/g.168752 Transcript_64460/m.168752 type:complete len:233 (+) Transcript_64460:1668-2366(+)